MTIVLDGRESTFTMGRDERVLDAALRVRGELPYACKGGVCSTCRARVVEGEVAMAHNYALEPDELAAGYVLTCQSEPGDRPASWSTTTPDALADGHRRSASRPGRTAIRDPTPSGGVRLRTTLRSAGAVSDEGAVS